MSLGLRLNDGKKIL